MDTTTLLIIIVIVLLLFGGDFTAGDAGTNISSDDSARLSGSGQQGARAGVESRRFNPVAATELVLSLDRAMV